MSIISQSHVDLVRSRKSLEHAFTRGDWQTMKAVDAEMGEVLNRAFDDSSRDAHALIKEMEKVLDTYARMVEALPKNASESLNFVPSTLS